MEITKREATGANKDEPGARMVHFLIDRVGFQIHSDHIVLYCTLQVFTHPSFCKQQITETHFPTDVERSPWNSSSSPHLKTYRLPPWGRGPLFLPVLPCFTGFLGGHGDKSPRGAQPGDESQSHMCKTWDLYIKTHCFGNSNLLFRIWTGILALKPANNSSFIWQQNSSLHLRKRAAAWEPVRASSMGWDCHRAAAGAVTMETDSHWATGPLPQGSEKVPGKKEVFLGSTSQTLHC